MQGGEEGELNLPLSMCVCLSCIASVVGMLFIGGASLKKGSPHMVDHVLTLKCARHAVHTITLLLYTAGTFRIRL